MHIYSAGQWVLLFFFYCFCGWVWESCYVSAKKRQWVNRGFLQGPLLPIYGSGAILILFVTLPAAEDLRAVFLLGMLAATALEYVTGAVMERLFKVRYWDYSTQPCNVNGYICLTSSLAWGVFSILLVRFLHPPVAHLLSRMPDVWIDPAAFVLTIAATVDTVQSVQAALDLREILTRLTEENEELRRLAKRAEVAAAFAEEDLRRFRERTAFEKAQLQERIETTLQQRRAVQESRTQQRQTALESRLRRSTEAKLQALGAIVETLESARAHLGETVGLAGETLAASRQELSDAIDSLRRRETAIRARTARTYRRSLRILRGNPTVRAREFGEVLESLRALGNRK